MKMDILVCLLVSFWLGGSEGNLIILNDNSSSHTYVDLLRGRDGLPGRDGMTGPQGPPGPQGEQGPAGPKSGGTTYMRWGKSVCPTSTGSQLVYSGYMVGSAHNEQGGGANYLCLTDSPEYVLPFRSQAIGLQGKLHAIEYEYPITGTHDHNAPCVLCHVPTRNSAIMIPGRASCPPSWTREYYGYVMSEHIRHRPRSSFLCVDRDLESRPGYGGHSDKAVIYHVEVDCTEIPCPPYNHYKEVNCVVCSK